MKHSWLILSVVVSVLSFSSISAQQRVLDSLIDLTFKNNPDIKASESLKESYRFQAEASGTLPDPSINIGFLNLPTNSLALDETPMSGINLGVSQKIPWLGKLSNQKKLADVNLRLADTKTDLIKNQIIKSLTDSYVAYSYWSLSIPIIEEFIGLLDATKSISEVRYENGDAPIQDILRIGTLRSRVKVRLIEAKQNRYRSLVSLRQITNDSNLTEQLMPSLDEINKADDNNIRLDNNPQLKQAELGIRNSEIKNKLSNSNYYPDFMLGVDYRIRENVMGDPVHGQDYLSFKVGFTLPLWFFKKQKNNNRAAEVSVISSKVYKQSVQNSLNARLHDTDSQIESLKLSIEEYDNSIIPESRAAVEAAQVAYEVGQVDFEALLSAQKDQFEIELERLNLLKRYHLSQAVLKELEGSLEERE